ncbi:MAG: DNA-binding protein [Clostridiales bacterium]|nr:DNA-binding protein [Clostridiales bacterium]
MNDNRGSWKCLKCNEKLAKKKTVFTYLGHNFSHEVMTCPTCGKVFIPKDLAMGKMAQVEEQLEDK